MSKVLANNEYTVEAKAAAYTMRQFPALLTVTNKVLVIAGRVPGAEYLFTVSSYNIQNDKW